MRNAFLLACAYLALLALAPPGAKAQSSVQPVAQPPVVPMAQLQAIAVTLSKHADTTIDCSGPRVWRALLIKNDILPTKGNEVDGFVEPTDVAGPMFIDVIHLPAHLCNAMQRVRQGAVDAGKGLGALVHESMHLALESGDEALVECTAYHNYWSALEPLHLSAHVARDTLSNMRYFHSTTLPIYQSVC